MDIATPKFCEACGKPLAPGSRFCEECGHTVAVETAPPAMASPAPVTLPLPPAGIAGPAFSAPPLPPAVAMPAVPRTTVTGGPPIKAILIAAVLLVLIGMGILCLPVSRQPMSRVTGKLPAASSQATPQPEQLKTITGGKAPTLVATTSAPEDDFTTLATDIKPVELAPEIPLPAPTPEDQTAAAQPWVDRGYAAEQAGNVKEALAAYEQALQLTGSRKLADHIQQLKKNSSSVAVPDPAPEPEPAPVPAPAPAPAPMPASVRVTPQMAQAATILHATGNNAAVLNGATQANTFVVAEPMVVTSIMTYHWNNAKGKTPGMISLEHEDGTQYGEWQAKGSDGQGGVHNANWNVVPGVVLKPGKYTLLDSHPASWSQNAATGSKGMCEIKGLPWRQAGGGR
jgi:hypothetical protein